MVESSKSFMIFFQFGIEDLKKEPNQTACWDGVRNYQVLSVCFARMKIPDTAWLNFFTYLVFHGGHLRRHKMFHSTCEMISLGTARKKVILYLLIWLLFLIKHPVVVMTFLHKYYSQMVSRTFSCSITSGKQPPPISDHFSKVPKF